MQMKWNQSTYIMGIVNLTPDSFSGDGLNNNQDPATAALKQAKQMLADGADILDLGAESSRPGSQEISPEEEAKRLLPPLKAIRAHTQAIISVDTHRAETAKLALEAGANWMNSIWGFKDPEMLDLIKRYDCPFILMHNGPFSSILDFFQQETSRAIAAGIKKENLILDPGIGFGKTPEENLQIISDIPKYKQLDFPILIGASRKSFIGAILDAPPQDRLAGSLACAAVATHAGADILRVHDVKLSKDLVRVCDAITRA